ncbi:hypothetical protein AWB67_03544 [Caballeronia terrestris]|uniref:Peptide-binding protein n=1 Tax=Caballeronia terrestris TaxID=1226301 RepID=A0A158J988_9BURK|nr:hypothetical protein [Caballeronia terrestris]SAL65416.1 hypothetical protein AWB67_03544 [Caballeronia terrestris]
MKGARQRGPVRPERIFKKTLLASALYAVLTTSPVFAQSSWPSSRDPAAFDRPVNTLSNRFDGRIVRAQQRTGKNQKGDRDSNANKPPTIQQVQSQQNDPPPARPPRHAVMTADERRLLRQHIEEAVRDLYKR